MVLVFIPIGVTFGVVTWALIRGRGGLFGLALSVIAGVVNAFLGMLAGQAIAGGGNTVAMGVGATLGALVAAVFEAVGWGPRPKSVSWHNPAGVGPPKHDQRDG